MSSDCSEGKSPEALPLSDTAPPRLRVVGNPCSEIKEGAAERRRDIRGRGYSSAAAFVHHRQCQLDRNNGIRAFTDGQYDQPQSGSDSTSALRTASSAPSPAAANV